MFAAIKEALEKGRITNPSDRELVGKIAAYVGQNPKSFTPDCRQFAREMTSVLRLTTAS